MKWLDSTGGPIVLVPADLVGRWSGWRGDDYEVACSVAEVGVVEVARDDGAFSVVSLWGEPMSTAYLDELDCVVQWRWAESEDDLLRSLRASWDELEWVPAGPALRLGAVAMFDASAPGGELDSDDLIRWTVDHGDRSLVVTAELDDGPSACRLVRLTDTP